MWSLAWIVHDQLHIIYVYDKTTIFLIQDHKKNSWLQYGNDQTILKLLQRNNVKSYNICLVVVQSNTFWRFCHSNLNNSWLCFNHLFWKWPNDLQKPTIISDITTSTALSAEALRNHIHVYQNFLDAYTQAFSHLLNSFQHQFDNTYQQNEHRCDKMFLYFIIKAKPSHIYMDLLL